MASSLRGDWFEKQTMGSLAERAARRWGAREALCFKGRRVTFADLSAGVDRVAKGLIALGIRPGDKVALWLVNGPAWIEAALGVMKIGAVLVPINTRLRTEDVAYIADQSDSIALILAERSGPVDYLAMVRELVPPGTPPAATRLPKLRHIALLSDQARPGTIAWEAVLGAGAAVDDATLAARADAVDPEDLAFLMYTSGTTGFPKGAMHCHRIIRNVTDRAFRLGITEHDVIMMYLPLFHLFAFSEGLLTSLVTGARQVLTEGFDPDESLDLMARERATVLHGFDTHYKELIEAQERAPRDIGSIRTGIAAAGMQSSTAIARRARKVFGPLVSGFGMSEIGVGVTIGSLDSTEEQCCEASGFPAIDADGWLHTGDMGLLRADGHLRFMGRYKDMLKIGGENVDPMEVEAFLMAHPAVNLAAVVSFPDARLSEVAVAFVRPEPGQALTEEDVLAHCGGRIASFKIPRRVIFVDAFPMTSSGKIQKVQLRAEALRRLS